MRTCRGCGLGEESFVVIKCSDHQVFQLVVRGVVEVRPRQASVLACVVIAGTREGLAGPRVLV